jgi:hypothetical protein
MKKIIAIETFISPNGKYRVLIAPDKQEEMGQLSIMLESNHCVVR